MRTVVLVAALVAVGCGGNVDERSVGTGNPEWPHGGGVGGIGNATAVAGSSGHSGFGNSQGGSAGNLPKNQSGSSGSPDVDQPTAGASGSHTVFDGGEGGDTNPDLDDGGASGSDSTITDGGATGNPLVPVSGSAGFELGSAGNQSAGASTDNNGGAAGSPTGIVCDPTFELVDGSCVCPIGTRKKYEECVSHCEYMGCDGDQFFHQMEPGETLWLSWKNIGCHEIVGFDPDGTGVVFAWYGDATQLRVSGLTKQDFPPLWYPSGDVTRGFCVALGSPANVVVTNDADECGPAPDMQYCCGDSCVSNTQP